MMAQSAEIKRVLFSRLQSIGVEPSIIPGLLKDMANSFVHDPNISLEQINRKLHSLGWFDIKIDYQIFLLAEAVLTKTSKVEHTCK